MYRSRWCRRGLKRTVDGLLYFDGRVRARITRDGNRHGLAVLPAELPHLWFWSRDAALCWLMDGTGDPIR